VLGQQLVEEETVAPAVGDVCPRDPIRIHDDRNAGRVGGARGQQQRGIERGHRGFYLKLLRARRHRDRRRAWSKRPGTCAGLAKLEGGRIMIEENLSV